MESSADISSVDFSVIFSGINCFLTLVLVIVTVISVKCAFDAYNHQKERAKKTAACELAKYYAQHIIIPYSKLSRVFRLSGLEAKIKTWFPYDKLEDFSYFELTDILSKNNLQLDQIRKEMYEIDPFVIYEAKLDFASSFQERNCIQSEYIDSDAPEKIKNIEALCHEFLAEIVIFLNDLEWFAMNCRYGLADEEIIYQSLHNTYLSQGWLLYYYISCSNKNNEDKSYTNVIWLFNHWKGRLIDIQQKAASEKVVAEKEFRDLEEQMSEVKKRCFEAESCVHVGKVLK